MNYLNKALIAPLLAFGALDSTGKDVVIGVQNVHPCTKVEWRKASAMPGFGYQVPNVKISPQIAIVTLAVNGRNADDPKYESDIKACGVDTAAKLSLNASASNTIEAQRDYGIVFRQCLDKNAPAVDVQSVYYKTELKCQ